MADIIKTYWCDKNIHFLFNVIKQKSIHRILGICDQFHKFLGQENGHEYY